MHRAARVEIHRSSPQRIIGARYQNLVAAVEQGAQREVDELAHAIADEHLLGGHAAHAPFLLLHHHGLARREYALLVDVALAVPQVLDHREAHGLGCAKAEGIGIADVQRDDVVAEPLEIERAARELAADLVPHVRQPLAGPDLFSHGHNTPS